TTARATRRTSPRTSACATRCRRSNCSARTGRPSRSFQALPRADMKRFRTRARAGDLALAALLLHAAACGADSTEQPAKPDAGHPKPNPDSLEALGLFKDAVAQTPASGVVPYDVNAVLYADEAEKLRFMALPAGTHADYDAMDFWNY